MRDAYINRVRAFPRQEENAHRGLRHQLAQTQAHPLQFP